MSSCSTPCEEEYVSWHTEARIPLNFDAVIAAPTPEPHKIIPLLVSPDWTDSATNLAKSG